MILHELQQFGKIKKMTTQLFSVKTNDTTLIKRKHKPDKGQHGAKQQFDAGLLLPFEQLPSFLL